MCKAEVEQHLRVALRRDRLRQPRVRRAAGRGADVPGLRPDQDRLSSGVEQLVLAVAADGAGARASRARRGSGAGRRARARRRRRSRASGTRRRARAAGRGRGATGAGAGRVVICSRDRGEARGADRRSPAPRCSFAICAVSAATCFSRLGRLRLRLPVREPRSAAARSCGRSRRPGPGGPGSRRSRRRSSRAPRAARRRCWTCCFGIAQDDATRSRCGPAASTFSDVG